MGTSSNKRLGIAIVALYLLSASSSSAQVVQLVKDINPATAPGGSYPQQLTPVGPLTYFAATDHANGLELWVTDGSAAGTTLLKDIYLGPDTSLYLNPGGEDRFANVNGVLFFSARARNPHRQSFTKHYSGLWRTDGTPSGTVLVKGFEGWNRPLWMTNLNGTLFFRMDATGTIWKSDGTSAGTVPAFEASSNAARDFVAANDRLFWTSQRSDSGWDVWTSDGTNAGTTVLPGPSGRRP